MNAELSEIDRIAAAHRVVFFFSGYLTQGAIAAGIDTIRLRLMTASVGAATQRRLLSTFVELCQNIIHYSADAAGAAEANVEDGATRFGTLCITAGDGCLGVTCTNPILAANAARLEHRLTKLRGMSREQIRVAYAHALRQDQTSDGSRGAGLGLLTLARDAAAPIEYSIEPAPAWGPEMRLFSLKVTH